MMNAVELNDEMLAEVNGGTLGDRVYLGTGAALLGLFFFQIPGAIAAAIWGSDDTPLWQLREQNKKQNKSTK